jgi:hypothetical protein
VPVIVIDDSSAAPGSARIVSPLPVSVNPA